MKFKNKETNEIIEWNCILIDSALLSAQNRKRMYWANFPITQPEDKKIFLKDITLSDVEPVALHNLYGGFSEKRLGFLKTNLRLLERQEAEDTSRLLSTRRIEKIAL